MRAFVFASAVTMFLAVQGLLLGRGLGFWSFPVGIALGYVEGQLLWRWMLRHARRKP